jgi:hypothetical protein
MSWSSRSAAKLAEQAIAAMVLSGPSIAIATYPTPGPGTYSV